MAEVIVMYSKFWNNVRTRLKDKKDGQKWLAKESGVGRTAINNGISKLNKPEPQGREIKNSPSVDNAFAIAKVLGATIEELVDGEVGVEYVRKVVRNDPRAIQVPDRLSSIVEDLLFLDENELRGIRANVEALAAPKKGKGTGTSGLLG
jgi:DNA-binding XRE family transcriptional regulator